MKTVATRMRASSIEFGSRHLIRPVRTFAAFRNHATQTSLGPASVEQRKHKRVTVFGDDGQISWGQLSTGEKAARTTQQSLNLAFIAGGAVATIAVFAFLYTDVFSQDSSISQYNHAVDRVRTDSECIELLGSPKKITAVGNPTGTSWVRQRPRATFSTDRHGTERMNMSFQMQGPVNRGMVQILMVRRQGASHFSYGYLALDVPGHPRIYLENGDEQHIKRPDPSSFLGIKWR